MAATANGDQLKVIMVIIDEQEASKRYESALVYKSRLTP